MFVPSTINKLHATSWLSPPSHTACLLKPEVARNEANDIVRAFFEFYAPLETERRETVEVTSDEERTSLTAVLCALRRRQIHQPLCVMDECACDTLTLDHLSAVELQQARTRRVRFTTRDALLLRTPFSLPRTCPACACAATAPVCVGLSPAALCPSGAPRVSRSSSFLSAACRPTATARRSSRS